ncbi:MAG: hypothetical protein QOJ02_4303, partial [Acidobacteriota bacterium]|nr:hypothetical protein [Acidobacteriota bacterium]
VPPEEPVGSLLPYPMMRDPSHPGVTYAIDGIPVSVDSFMSAVESSFPSRFDLLEMSARASRPRLLGSRVYDPAGRLVGQYAPADAGRAVAMAFEYNGTLERDWLVTDNWTAALNFLNFTEQPIAPQNPYPGFDRGKLGDVNKALDKGAKLLKNSDCQKGLAQAGINVSDLLNAFGSLKARPASDPSSRGYNIFYAEKSTDPQVQQFMQTEKGKGAGGFIFGQDVMLRDTFFYARGGAKIAGGVAQALALIHEAIHLTGKSDEFFGGSSKLNDVVIHACFSKLYGHNDLAIVGN